MASVDHEAILELFRGDPRLVAQVMRAAFDLGLPEVTGHSVESTLGEVAPTEYRADLVVAFGDARVIVEVQLGKDAQKHWTWPNYVTTLRARERCQVYLLVVTTSSQVARWAGETIPLGNPGSSFLPLVLGPETCPRITDVEIARQFPKLAILSGLLQAGRETDIEVWKAALTGVMALEGDQAVLYGDLLLRAADAVARQVLEVLMSTSSGYEFQSEFAKKYWSKGREQGREEGRISATAEAVIKILTGRELPPTDAERRAIMTATDLATLERWLIHALSASSVEELLGANSTTPQQ